MTQTTEWIRTKIDKEGLKAGDKLPTLNQLASELGVSRTVVRDAVIALAADGVLESRHGVGVFVLGERLPPAEVALLDSMLAPLASIKATFMDLLELRMALEVHACGLAAARRSWAQETTIWDAAAAFEQAAGDDDRLDLCDAAFHQAIAEATNNAAFIEAFKVLCVKITPRPAFSRQVDPALITPQYVEQSVTEHRAICEAISAGDAERAQQAMRAHLARGHRRYRNTPQSQTGSPYGADS
jgi:DNA-binding FadR family transcriptional regulator